jgi:OOP family OmpA-OmpF porin
MADERPDMPEELDSEDDGDGCPDLACRIDPCQIKLLEPLYFESEQWKLDKRSHKLLGDVAGVMRIMPLITVEIRGHTDSKGGDADNLALSQRRGELLRTDVDDCRR